MAVCIMSWPVMAVLVVSGIGLVPHGLTARNVGKLFALFLYSVSSRV